MTSSDAITKADQLVERGASFLEGLARKASAKGGTAAKLAEPLTDDAVFLRKLKPSLVAARLRGEEPEDGAVKLTSPGAGGFGAERSSWEQATPPKPKPGKSGGPNPIVIAGAAFVAGIFLAKLVDWRGHAYPRH